MLFRPPMFQGAGFGGLRVEVLGFKYLRVLGLRVINGYKVLGSWQQRQVPTAHVAKS